MHKAARKPKDGKIERTFREISPLPVFFALSRLAGVISLQQSRIAGHIRFFCWYDWPMKPVHGAQVSNSPPGTILPGSTHRRRWISTAMTVDLSHLQQEAPDGSWQKVEHLFDEIAALARAPLALREFHRRLLDCVSGHLESVGGTVWWLASGDQVRLEYSINLAEVGLPPADPAHRRLVHSVLRRPAPQIAMPQSGADDVDALGNPTGFVALLCPLYSEGAAVGVIELFLDPGLAAAT
jgi:hypothetical protein